MEVSEVSTIRKDDLTSAGQSSSAEMSSQSSSAKTLDDLIKLILDEEGDHKTGIGFEHSTVNSERYNNIISMDITMDNNGSGGSNMDKVLTDSQGSDMLLLHHSEQQRITEELLGPFIADYVTLDEGDMQQYGILPPSMSMTIEELNKTNTKLDIIPPQDDPGDQFLNLFLKNGIETNENTIDTGSHIDNPESCIDMSELFLLQNFPDISSLISPVLENTGPVGSDTISFPAMNPEKITFVYSSEEQNLTLEDPDQNPYTADNTQENAPSSNALGYEPVPSYSSGKSPTKRGRPPKKPAAPTQEVLEQLPEEQRRALMQKYKNNEASWESRRKKKEQELQNEIERDRLLKINTDLKKKKTRIQEYLKRLEEECKRVYK